jgi:heme exporter protein A
MQDRAPMTALRLEGRGLACVRGGREIFAGLSFAVEGGKALAVTGRNGAGKTSLLRIVAGLLAPTAGEVELSGGGEETLAERAHYIGHRDTLKPSLTVQENLAFWRDFLGRSGDGGLPLLESLETVGLDHAADLPAAYLSAGQRRRLSFARLLAVPRPLWLLDEPLSSLDAAGQALTAELMSRHLAGNGLILAATHETLPVKADELRIGP